MRTAAGLRLIAHVSGEQAVESQLLFQQIEFSLVNILSPGSEASQRALPSCRINAAATEEEEYTMVSKRIAAT